MCEDRRAAESVGGIGLLLDGFCRALPLAYCGNGQSLWPYWWGVLLFTLLFSHVLDLAPCWHERRISAEWTETNSWLANFDRTSSLFIGNSSAFLNATHHYCMQFAFAARVVICLVAAESFHWGISILNSVGKPSTFPWDYKYFLFDRNWARYLRVRLQGR